MGYVAEPMVVKPGDRKVLESWVRSPTVPQALALRAKIVLASGDGEAVRPMAKRLVIDPKTVTIWRGRYRKDGLGGLRTRPRSGRPRRMSDGKERSVVAATMRPPKATTHWSASRLAKEVHLSRSTVHRIELQRGWID